MIKVFAAAVTLVSFPAAAVAQERGCIPREDAKEAMIFALPHVVDAARGVCGDILPPTAFLNTGATTYSERLRAEHPDSRRAVGRVFARFAGELPDGLTPETSAAMMGEVLAGAVAKDIKPDSCPLVDQLAASVAALPEDDLANAITIILQLTEKSRTKGKSAPTLCPAGPA